MFPMINRSRLQSAAAILTMATAVTPLLGQHYAQTNLVSDQAGAPFTDPNLVNPWGLSRSSGSPWWVSDNGMGVSTLYDGTGSAKSLVVTIPPADPKSGATGTPTGTVFNGTMDFLLAPSAPALFMFVTEDGTVSGWNPGVNATNAVIKVNDKNRSVFKGVAIATTNPPWGSPATFLYVADFRKGRVQIFDTAFHHVHEWEDRFEDERLPEGYAPFNIQNIGGNLYVAFAKQDSEKHDEVDGSGLGFVDVFSPNGRLLRRLEHGPWFNAPWGMALASGDFGIYSHDVIVGQFGSGEILVFDPVTGRFLGRLNDANDHTVKIDGLWGISFGSGTGSGSATALYFSAGSDHEQHGLFGTITPIENPRGNGQ